MWKTIVGNVVIRLFTRDKEKILNGGREKKKHCIDKQIHEYHGVFFFVRNNKQEDKTSFKNEGKTVLLGT